MAGAAGSPDSQREPRPRAPFEPALRDVGPAPKPASELKARVVSALALGVVALLMTWWGGWPFALLWLSAGLAVLLEWAAMTPTQPRPPFQTVLGAGPIALLITDLLPFPLRARR